jgi:hypothetical protein
MAEPVKYQRRVGNEQRQGSGGKTWAEWKQELLDSIEQLDYACSEARQIIYKLRPLLRPKGERSL